MSSNALFFVSEFPLFSFSYPPERWFSCDFLKNQCDRLKESNWTERGIRKSDTKTKPKREEIKKKNHITIQITTRVKRTLAKHNNSSKQLIGMLFRRVSDLCFTFYFFFSNSLTPLDPPFACVCEHCEVGVWVPDKRVLLLLKWLKLFLRWCPLLSFTRFDLLLFIVQPLQRHSHRNNKIRWLCKVHISSSRKQAQHDFIPQHIYRQWATKNFDFFEQRTFTVLRPFPCRSHSKRLRHNILVLLW